jgi:hypothetical protein
MKQFEMTPEKKTHSVSISEPILFCDSESATYSGYSIHLFRTAELKKILLLMKSILTTALILLCNISVKSQSQNLTELTQKVMTNTVDWLYGRFENFDRECFLAGTLDDNNGHYQIFTANKSIDDIDGKVKWLFGKELKFVPDTMRRQRITTYGDERNVPLALFIVSLFKNDYPDLRALRVCSVCPFVRRYGSVVKTADGNRDPVCNSTANFEIELFSPSLANTVAGYYNFDYNNIATVSSGGDIGYRGIINSAKIATYAQKMSFLAGVFLRYEGFFKNDDGRYSVRIPNSHGTAKECVDILKEFGCTNLEEIPAEHKIVFSASGKIAETVFLVYDLYVKVLCVEIAY